MSRQGLIAGQPLPGHGTFSDPRESVRDAVDMRPDESVDMLADLPTHRLPFRNG